MTLRSENGVIKVGTKRGIGIAFVVGVLTMSIYSRDFVAITPIALSSLLMLTFLNRIALKLGFTKDVLSFSDPEIDGKKHIINLEGFDSEKVLRNIIVKMIIIPAVIVWSIAGISLLLIQISELSTIACGIFIPILVLFLYLMVKVFTIDEIKTGTTTIEVIP